LHFSDRWRRHSLTANTLLGPGKFDVAPFVWLDSDSNCLVSILYLGKDLCGYPGIIHGGVLATILDEGLAQCCFQAISGKAAVTAKLDIKYRKPVPAGSFVVLRAETVKVEGRKTWVRGHVETLPAPEESPLILAEAEALFITPKNWINTLFSQV
jgi:3'-phosphoadenosine 5'-phosphosulfate synthase